MCLGALKLISHAESELTISVFKTMFCENCIPNFYATCSRWNIMVAKNAKIFIVVKIKYTGAYGKKKWVTLDLSLAHTPIIPLCVVNVS